MVGYGDSVWRRVAKGTLDSRRPGRDEQIDLIPWLKLRGIPTPGLFHLHLLAQPANGLMNIIEGGLAKTSSSPIVLPT